MNESKSKRIKAWLIDIAIICLIYTGLTLLKKTDFLLFYSTWMKAPGLTGEDQIRVLNESVQLFDAAFTQLMILIFAYNISQLLIFKTTIGKVLFKITVQDAKPTSRIPFIIRLFFREMLKVFSMMFVEGLPFVFMIIAFLVSKDARSNIDQICRTKVAIQ
jgi:hypothetical protein